MIGVNITVDAINGARMLKQLSGQEMKWAQKAALVRAAEATITASATKIAAQFNVKKWQILGVGGAKESKGGRLGKSQPRPMGRAWGIALYLRTASINPAGTNYKTVPGLRQLKNGSVKAGSHKYPDAWIEDSKYGGKYIRFRGRNGGKPYARIQIDGGGSASGKTASRILSGAAQVIGAPTFKRRFEHELKARVNRVVKKYQRR